MSSSYLSSGTVHLEAPSSPVVSNLRVAVMPAAILCSDIVGAKQLFAEVPGLRYFEWLQEHIKIISQRAAGMDGDVFGMDGDSVFVALRDDIGAALTLAAASQSQGRGLPYGYSIGISTGEVVKKSSERGVEFQGPVVAMAKAMSKIGNKSGIFLSPSAFKAAQDVGLERIRQMAPDISRARFGEEEPIPNVPYFGTAGRVVEFAWNGELFGQKSSK
jgi:class 3 adenylate cyclase